MDFLNAGDDGMYMSETSSAVLDLDKCLAVCSKSGSDILLDSTIGKAMLHHLIKTPDKVAAAIVPLVFDIKVRSQILEVVKFLHTAASQDSLDTYNSFMSVFCNIVKSDGNVEALFSTCFIIMELSSSLRNLSEKQKVSQQDMITLFLSYAIDLLKIATTTGTVSKKDKNRPSKLGLKAVQCVGSILSNLPEITIKKYKDSYNDVIWGYYSHSVNLLKLVKKWYDGHRPIFVVISSALLERLNQISDQKSVLKSSFHNNRRVGIQESDDQITSDIAVSEILLITYEQIGILVSQIDFSCELRKLMSIKKSISENQHTMWNYIVKLSVCLGSLSQSEQKELFNSNNRSAAKERIAQLVSPLLVLLNTKSNTVPLDDSLKRIIHCMLTVVVTSEDNILPQLNLSEFIEIVRGCGDLENSSLSSIAVKLSVGRIRTVVSELLNLGNNVAIFSVKEIFFYHKNSFVNTTTETELLSVVNTVLKSESVHSLELIKILPTSKLVLKSILHRSLSSSPTTIPPRLLQEAFICMCVSTNSIKVSFLSLLYDCFQEYNESSGEAFDPKVREDGGEIENNMNAPLNPSDIGFCMAKNQTPKFKNITELSKEAITCWIEVVLEEGEIPRLEILEEFLTLFSKQCKEEFVVACTTIATSKLLQNSEGRSCPVQSAALIKWISSSVEKLLNSKPDDIFLWLSPMLVLRPLSQSFFNDSDNSKQIIPLLKSISEKHSAKETQRLCWEILSRCRPIYEVVEGDCTTEDSLKLRIFAICNASASLLENQNISQKDWELVLDCHRLYNDKIIPSSKNIKDSVALQAAVSDCGSLSLASIMRCVKNHSQEVMLILKKIKKYSPELILSSLSYIRKSNLGIPPTLPEIMINVIIEDDGCLSPIMLEILFNLVYSSPSGSLHLRDVTQLTVTALDAMSGSIEKQLGGLKLLGSLLAKTEQFAALSPETIQMVISSLSDISSRGNGTEQQLASQLLSVLLTGGK